MKNRVTVMCSLMLAASLSSCAPSFTAGGADIKVGHDVANVQRVYLKEIRDDTPQAAYVLLPDCSNGAVALRDVRRLGPQRAAQLCNEAVAKPPVDTCGMTVMAGAIATGFLLYYFVFKSKVDGAVKQFTGP